MNIYQMKKMTMTMMYVNERLFQIKFKYFQVAGVDQEGDDYEEDDASDDDYEEDDTGENGEDDEGTKSEFSNDIKIFFFQVIQKLLLVN